MIGCVGGEGEIDHNCVIRVHAIGTGGEGEGRGRGGGGNGGGMGGVNKKWSSRQTFVGGTIACSTSAKQLACTYDSASL